MKTKRNKFNVEWIYAKQVWDALKNGREVPPIPNYDVWEVNEKGEKKLIKQIPIEPMTVRCNGKTFP